MAHLVFGCWMPLNKRWISIPVISWKHFFCTISSNGYLDVSGACYICMYYITMIILNHKNHNFYTYMKPCQSRFMQDPFRWPTYLDLSVASFLGTLRLLLEISNWHCHIWSIINYPFLITIVDVFKFSTPYWVAICVWFVRCFESLPDPLGFIGRLRRPHQAPKSSLRMEPYQIHHSYP